MPRLLRLAAVLVTGAASGVAQPASPPEPSQTGRFTVTASGLVGPTAVGVRYAPSNRYALGLNLDRSAFAPDDPSVRLDVPFVGDAPDAWTVAASLTSITPVLGGRVQFVSGAEVYYQRQTDDVLLGVTDDFEAVLSDQRRRVDGAGFSAVYRLEARVVGPLSVGFGGGAIGLGLQRIRGGTVRPSTDGATPSGLERSPDRLRLSGGSSTMRWYLAVRL